MRTQSPIKCEGCWFYRKTKGEGGAFFSCGLYGKYQIYPLKEKMKDCMATKIIVYEGEE